MRVGEGPATAFGTWHPAGAAGDGRAVLLLPPFGWEDMCSYRARRDWAQALADAGRPTLRIDFPGTGDSPGGPRDPERLAAWVGAVAAGARWLRGRAPGATVVALGVGFGGLVAAQALAAGAADVEELVLWGVPARGRGLVRELRAFARMEDAPAPENGPAPAPDGLGVGGYLLAEATLAALGEVDLGASWAAPPARALVLGRDDRPADPTLVAGLAAAGAHVAAGPGEGYAQLTMTVPELARRSSAVEAQIDAWLGERPPAGPATPLRPAATEEGAPPAAGLALATPDGPVRERPWGVEHAFGRVVGVLAEPAGPARAMRVLLLNAGPQRRTGPNRMWVELARRWAARGVPVLRVDLAGIGDAEGDASPFVETSAFYADEYGDQVRAILDELDADGVRGPCVVGGLCAGAYWSLRAALADPRVPAALMVNPGALAYDGGLTGTLRSSRTIAAKLLRPATWKRVLRRESSIAWHLRVARALAREAVLAPLRLPGRIRRRRAARAAGGTPEDAVLDALRDAGKRATMIFTGEEPVFRELERAGQWSRLARWPGVRLERVEVAADVHTLRPLWLQREVHLRLDAALDAELARLEAPAPGTAPAAVAVS